MICDRKSRAFTLVEMVVSMAVTAVLMTGLASALVIASHAIPDGENAPDNTAAAFRISEQLTSDLATAAAFTQLGPNLIEFKVRDRNADGIAETIRYQWSGAAGDPLTHTYNALPGTILENVQDFYLVYGKQSKDTTTMQTVTNTTPEARIAYFDGWAAIAPTSQEKGVSATAWVSQYFTLTPPAGTEQIRFTRVKVMMRRDVVVPLGNTKIELYRPATVGTYTPGATPLVTAPAFASSSLPTLMAWKEVLFNNSPITDLSRNDYAVVLKGDASGTVWVQDYFNSTAPDNGMVETWTTDSGGAWTGTTSKALHKQDVRFYLYGSYVSSSQQNVTTTTSKLDMVRVSVRAGPEPKSQVDTDIPILNQPDVTGL